MIDVSSLVLRLYEQIDLNRNKSLIKDFIEISWLVSWLPGRNCTDSISSVEYSTFILGFVKCDMVMFSSIFYFRTHHFNLVPFILIRDLIILNQ